LLIFDQQPVLTRLLPAGKLTETQVLLSHTDKLHLDRYGFIVTDAEAHARAKVTAVLTLCCLQAS
jgi:hypothetical protein